MAGGTTGHIQRTESEHGESARQQKATPDKGGDGVITGASPPVPFKQVEKKSISLLAKDARHTLEVLLEGLGWPKDEEAFHRCIDRLLQIEEGHR